MSLVGGVSVENSKGRNQHFHVFKGDTDSTGSGINAEHAGVTAAATAEGQALAVSHPPCVTRGGTESRYII